MKLNARRAVTLHRQWVGDFTTSILVTDTVCLLARKEIISYSVKPKNYLSLIIHKRLVRMDCHQFRFLYSLQVKRNQLKLKIFQVAGLSNDSYFQIEI